MYHVFQWKILVKHQPYSVHPCEQEVWYQQNRVGLGQCQYSRQLGLVFDDHDLFGDGYLAHEHRTEFLYRTRMVLIYPEYFKGKFSGQYSLVSTKSYDNIYLDHTKLSNMITMIRGKNKISLINHSEFFNFAHDLIHRIING